MLFLKVHAFVKPFSDIAFHDQKVFIICQHLIVYLSHITIVCPIIASKYIYLEAIQIYSVNLFSFTRLGCIATFTGLDYWTNTFLVFTNVMVGLIGFRWLQGACGPSLNDEHKQFIKQKQSSKDFSTSIALTHTAHV